MSTVWVRSSTIIYFMLLICSPLVRHIRRFGQLQQDGIKQYEGGVSNGSATELVEASDSCAANKCGWLLRECQIAEKAKHEQAQIDKQGRRCEAEEPQQTTINKEQSTEKEWQLTATLEVAEVVKWWWEKLESAAYDRRNRGLLPLQGDGRSIKSSQDFFQSRYK